MTIGVVKPGSTGLRHGGFRSGGRNLGRGGVSSPIRHNIRGLGAGHAFSLQNRITRQGNFTGAKYFGGVGRLMSGQPVTIREVKMYMNSYLVMKKTFNAIERFLDKKGAYIAKDAARSMRKGKVSTRNFTTKSKRKIRKGQKIASEPGSPPRAWKGFLKHPSLMNWFVNRVNQTVMVGPALLPRSKSPTPVPGLHEHGKNKLMKLYRWRGKGKRVFAGTKNVKYPKRPYMVPALQKNQGIRELKNSVK